MSSSACPICWRQLERDSLAASGPVLDGFWRGSGRTARKAHQPKLCRRPCGWPALRSDDRTAGDRGTYRTTGIGGTVRIVRRLILATRVVTIESGGHGTVHPRGASRRQVKGEKEGSQNEGYAREPSCRALTGSRSKVFSTCTHGVPSHPEFPTCLRGIVTYRTS